MKLLFFKKLFCFFGCFGLFLLLCSFNNKEGFVLPYANFGFIVWRVDERDCKLSVKWYIKDSFSTPVKVEYLLSNDGESVFLSVFGAIIDDMDEAKKLMKKAGISHDQEGFDNYKIVGNFGKNVKFFYKDKNGLHQIAASENKFDDKENPKHSRGSASEE